ncbi:hypothetical protein HK100_008384 [Physocladia obscura]|uniref:Uncharacterized protein n=1 Tax=Physocladia obscura TaxID=109957 RepID=A0AAD5X7S8_9FUNG|nr:hypothetical protein HK100_008384 [Physocladia obscura]
MPTSRRNKQRSTPTAASAFANAASNNGNGNGKNGKSSSSSNNNSNNSNMNDNGSNSGGTPRQSLSLLDDAQQLAALRVELEKHRFVSAGVIRQLKAEVAALKETQQITPNKVQNTTPANKTGIQAEDEGDEQQQLPREQHQKHGEDVLLSSNADSAAASAEPVHPTGSERVVFSTNMRLDNNNNNRNGRMVLNSAGNDTISDSKENTPHHNPSTDPNAATAKHIAALEEQIFAAKGALALATPNDTKDAGNDERKTAAAQINALETQVEQATKTIRDLQMQLAQLSEQRDAAVKQGSLLVQRSFTDGDSGDLVETNATTADKIQALETHISQLQETVKSKTAELQASVAEREKLAKLLEEKEVTVVGLRGIIKSMENAIINYSSFSIGMVSKDTSKITGFPMLPQHTVPNRIAIQSFPSTKESTIAVAAE